MASPPIGLKIKRARERLRMTQAALGERIGVSQKTIDNWEHDRRYPKSSIGALEEVLGISLDDQEESTPTLSAESQSALRAALGDEDFEAVMAFLEDRRRR